MVFDVVFMFRLPLFYCFANNILCGCTLFFCSQNRNEQKKKHRCAVKCMVQRVLTFKFETAAVQKKRDLLLHCPITACPMLLFCVHTRTEQQQKKNFSRDKLNFSPVQLCTINWRWTKSIAERDLCAVGIGGRLFNRNQNVRTKFILVSFSFHMNLFSTFFFRTNFFPFFYCLVLLIFIDRDIVWICTFFFFCFFTSSCFVCFVFVSFGLNLCRPIVFFFAIASDVFFFCGAAFFAEEIITKEIKA